MSIPRIKDISRCCEIHQFPLKSKLLIAFPKFPPCSDARTTRTNTSRRSGDTCCWRTLTAAAGTACEQTSPPSPRRKSHWRDSWKEEAAPDEQQATPQKKRIDQRNAFSLHGGCVLTKCSNKPTLRYYALNTRARWGDPPRSYSQRTDVVGADPRNVGGPDANDGLPGAAACRRTSESLLQMARLGQEAERQREQCPDLESRRHLSSPGFCMRGIGVLLRTPMEADGTARFHPAPWNAALAPWHQQISCSSPPSTFIIY